MRSLRAILHRLRGLFSGANGEREMNDELRAHLDALIERNVAAGMDPEEAHFAALRAFGGVEQIKARARDERRSVWGEQLWQDICYALRQAGKHPGFALIVVLILGFGIGVSTTVFSALELLLLRSLPVAEPGELVIPKMAGLPGMPETRSQFITVMAYEQIRDHSQSLAGVLAINGSSGMRTLVANDFGQGGPVQVRSSDVSGNYFSVLGVGPALGRMITPDDDRPSASRAVAVLSHAFWTSRFGGDSAVVGRMMRIENVAFEIIGVAAPGFFGVHAGEAVDVWTPLQMLPAVDPSSGGNLKRPGWGGLFVMGRLRAGVSLATATTEIDLLYQQRSAAQRPELSPTERVRQFGKIKLERGRGGFHSQLRHQGGPILGLLLGVVALVQLIACANVASLFLARLTTRQRELAARAALGADRGRLVRQLATEMLVLVTAGVALAGAMVFLGFVVVQAQGLEVQPSGWVFAFAALMSALTGLVVAVVPALRSTRIDVATALKRGASGAGRAGMPLQKLLVTIQLAASACLVAGTGLLVRTLHNLRQVDIGYRAESLLLVAIETPRDYNAQRRAALAQELIERVGAHPGVRGVTLSSMGFLTGGQHVQSVSVEGYMPQRDEIMATAFSFIGVHYFDTVGLPLVRGRGLERSEVFPINRDAPHKAVVTEAWAKRFYGAADPIGRRFRGGSQGYEIVGVAKNVKYSDLRQDAPLVAYVPFSELTWHIFGLQVRTDGPARALGVTLGKLVQQIDPNVRARAEGIDEVLGRATREERFVALGVGGFSVLALLLTSLGVYGLIACNVAQRTKEIGVRMALGGPRASIIALVLKQGMRLALVGWVVGVVAAALLVRFIESRLYHVGRGDPGALLVAGLVLLSVALLACWLPAWRATKVDPMIALRSE